MSKGSHAFHEIYLHLNWHCYLDQPMLIPPARDKVHAHIEGYCRHLPGVYLKGIGGTKDHIHLAVEIEPTVVIDQMIGRIKGASARELNKYMGLKFLRWQRGYGAVSFAKMNLPGILKYIELQEKHHGEGTINEKLELCGFEEALDEEEENDGGDVAVNP